MPVEVMGLNDLPVSGDNFKVFEDDKDARAIAHARSINKIEKERRANSVSLDELGEQVASGQIKEVNVIVKADVQGTAEEAPVAVDANAEAPAPEAKR